MSNIKKIIIYLLIFLSFFSLGLLVSRVQANDAQITLATNGLSADAKEFTSPKSLEIKEVISYLAKNFKKEHVQLQLTKIDDPNQVLVWSNFDVTNLPLASNKGRFFQKSDFEGAISFALVTQTNSTEVLETHGNLYLNYEGNYITVLGKLKESFLKDNYYVTTGLKQQNSLQNITNFTILIDGLTKKQNAETGKFLHARYKEPAFITEIVKERKTPAFQFILATLAVIVSLVLTIVLAIWMRRTYKETNLSNVLFKNLQVNLVVRFFGLTLVLGLISLIVSYYFLYFSNISDYVILIGLIILLQNISYSTILLPKIKQEGTK